MCVATVIAALGLLFLFFVEVLAVAVMVALMLSLMPIVVGVMLSLFACWVIIAGVYRRVMPVPLVVGRISHDGMAEAVERFARGVTRPGVDVTRRQFGAAVLALGVWLPGVALVEYSATLTPPSTVVALGIVAGVGTAAYHTGRTIADELVEGGTIEQHLEQVVDVVDPDDESPLEDLDRSLADLQTRVDRLANQAGAPAPTVRVGRERVPVAATAGFRPETSTIAVSSGLCDALSDRELEAVLAHELAHVVNRDAAVLTALSLPVAKADSLDERVSETLENDDSSLRPLHHPGIVLVAMVVSGFSRWAVVLVARYREYVADRGAVALTGDPAALASALETLDRDVTRRPSSDLRTHRSTAAFSIVPPPWEEHRFFDRTRRFVARRIFGTHPPTEKRIERLRARA